MNVKTFMGAFDAAKERIDSLKVMVEDTREKIAKFNPKKWKTLAIVLGIIAFVLIAAAITLSIIAIVKSSKTVKMVKGCCDEEWERGCECEIFDDEEYNFSLDDHIITENDVPDDEKEETV